MNPCHSTYYTPKDTRGVNADFRVDLNLSHFSADELLAPCNRIHLQ